MASSIYGFSGQPEHFFKPVGNATLKLSRNAAIQVCLTAAPRGFVVLICEGGIWHAESNTFEARTDCIIHAQCDPPLTRRAAQENNERFARMISAEAQSYDAFVLTVAPLTGNY